MVTFYELKDGKPSNPVLFLDTLKVSTIEQTAETSDATGGKGNGKLISWDYGKEITVTLEDALFSAKSMAIMFGNGAVEKLKAATDADVTGKKLLMKTETFTCTTAATGLGDKVVLGGKEVTRVNPKYYDETGASVAVAALVVNTKYFCTYDIEVENEGVIEISANSFPGTYYVVGDTYARSEADGRDEFFQFIIPKAKVTAENTITLEAEGDPSVFNMNLTVLRPADGVMMKLVKYGVVGDESSTGSVESEIFHNHTLNPLG